MRLIDAEQFEVISWSAQGQRGDYARGYDDGVQYVAAKIDHTPTIDAIPVEWLRYMQQESLSENDRTMVGAIEAIFIEWHIYVNRLREKDRQKEQEAR
ncbi:MAG: hypothetical protein IKE23_07890 [Exiguobacterium sp.]|nr:hypothetical protein [Exiguobacterium sp.]